ncbi:hypothetical protein ACRV3Q_001704 [Enterobacter hormaechei]
MQHTPGPWYWDSEGLGNKNHIVFGKEYPVEMTSKANKCLIIAAPDLLEALLNIVDMEHDVSEWDAVYATARAAISKALGEE